MYLRRDRGNTTGLSPDIRLIHSPADPHRALLTGTPCSSISSSTCRWLKGYAIYQRTPMGMMSYGKWAPLMLLIHALPLCASLGFCRGSYLKSRLSKIRDRAVVLVRALQRGALLPAIPGGRSNPVNSGLSRCLFVNIYATIHPSRNDVRSSCRG
jgi:hypothetical protein